MRKAVHHASDCRFSDRPSIRTPILAMVILFRIRAARHFWWGESLDDLEERVRQRIENLRLILLRSEPPTSVSVPARELAIDEIPNAREVQGRSGKCLWIEKEIDAYLDTNALAESASQVLSDEGETPSFMFLDLETTGLAATPLFLAGTAFMDRDKLKVVQLLARDYSEEAAVVSILDDLLSRFDTCITFNGKSFDIPYLRERSKYHKIDLRSAPRHFDLLHHARRAWKHCLPNCRLITLEWYILGRRRIGDVPGWEVPCIYHDFVHTKDARRLTVVIRHNLMDILSMAELLVILAETKRC